MDHSSLGNRMKGYESVSKTRLMKRTPVILRLDGCHFHTFTKGFEKPFDDILVKTMQETMKFLCENIQGCVLGYTQSDEITLVLVDYENLNTCPWYDNEVQKMCSVAASIATLQFNKVFARTVHEIYDNLILQATKEHELITWNKLYDEAIKKGAYFDCRAFNVPKDEVCNNLIWRQQDATRNSKQALGQANFSHKELQNKTCNMIQDMLHEQKGINWNNLPTTLKRGSCCIKKEQEVIGKNGEKVIRHNWIIDNEIPIFTQDRNYIEKLINFE